MGAKSGVGRQENDAKEDAGVPEGACAGNFWARDGEKPRSPCRREHRAKGLDWKWMRQKADALAASGMPGAKQRFQERLARKAVCHQKREKARKRI